MKLMFALVALFISANCLADTDGFAERWYRKTEQNALQGRADDAAKSAALEQSILNLLSARYRQPFHHVDSYVPEFASADGAVVCQTLLAQRNGKTTASVGCLNGNGEQLPGIDTARYMALLKSLNRSRR